LELFSSPPPVALELYLHNYRNADHINLLVIRLSL